MLAMLVTVGIGFLAGAASLFGAAWFHAHRTSKDRLADREQVPTGKKLAEARRYLGVIATRQSINEARKIANKALKATK